MASPRTTCPACLRCLRAASSRRLPTAPLRRFSEVPRQTRLLTTATAPPPFPPTPTVRSKAFDASNLVSSRRSAAQSRQFSASKPVQRTVLNPRNDEEGNEMTVEITPRASHRLASLMSSDANPDLLLRVRVESGGCHGFQYGMSLTSRPEISEEEDTVFESDDGKGAKVVMDEPSLELLKGSKLDYSIALMGSEFKIVDNPRATSGCGCGTSFDIS